MSNIHLIGNAHLDPVWLWRWQEGFAEIKATFRSALDRMEEFPDFKFTCACASYYKWVEENEPALFEEVRGRVNEGRWILAGGWWLQPDCNLPCGESFARHALYAQRYFWEKFGRTATFGYNVDSFGHNGMLPQLLFKSGLNAYVFMRPEAHEKALPANAFLWEGPDGSRVAAYRIPYHYGTGWDMGELEEKFGSVCALSKKQGLPQMCFYGVGNHGGGPTTAALMKLDALIETSGEGAAVYSDPETYFKELRASGAELPVVRDELQHHASGCYSNHSELKANNRKAECRLMGAERMMAAASLLLGLPYRGDLVRRAWEDVLFNQFHDIMGGCCVREAYDDARDTHGEALKIAGDLLNAALQKISWNIDTMGEPAFRPSKDCDWALWEQRRGGAPAVVFNTLCWDVDAHIRITGQLSGVTDEQGNPLSMQLVRAPRTNVNDKWDTLIHAAIPAMGYRVFRAFTEKPLAGDPGPRALGYSPYSLENDWLRLEVDANTGCISSLFDKKKGVEVFHRSGAVPIVIEDSGSDTWAHGVLEFRCEAGRFAGADVRLIEAGPLRATLRAVSRYGDSALRQDFSLYRDRPGVEVSAMLDWREKHKMLKLAFPVNVSDPKPVYEIPYGALERPADGLEQPGQAWVDISGRLEDGTEYGLALANTTKYSYDALASELRMTAARSPMYADHYGARDEFAEYMDQGNQYFTYLLLPHAGDWRQSGAVRRSQELLNPPVTVLETYHKGSLPQAGSFIFIGGGSVIAPVLKEAEDGGGLILRCVETLGEKTETEIDLKLIGRKWKAGFGPFEIKTFLIRDSGDIEETNLIEGI